jgi:hypothetical protein
MGRQKQQWQVTTGLIYGHIKKVYRHRKVVRITPVMQRGTFKELRTALMEIGLSGRLKTAFVERVNLTIRQRVAALARRTWSTAQATPQLLAHIQWWQAYYHVIRPHAALRVALAQPLERGGKRVPQRYHQRTPAMAAGLTSRRWTVQEVLALPVPSACGAA